MCAGLDNSAGGKSVQNSLGELGEFSFVVADRILKPDDYLLLCLADERRCFIRKIRFKVEIVITEFVDWLRHSLSFEITRKGDGSPLAC